MAVEKNLVSKLSLGFIGLGDMGAPMASNIARRTSGDGTELHVFDISLHPESVPETATATESISAIAEHADIVFISVPDGKSSLAVVEELISRPDARVRCVVNLSTVGIRECEQICSVIPKGAFDYIDAPVSGGKAGARNATISIMWSGSRALFDELQAVLSTFAKSIFYVGERPGQGQALKLLNNYLSGAAMTATSEAVRFGQHHGLDMKTMLDVVHVSTGQNMAVSDKFPNRILTETYDAGFRMALMQKDISLYRDSVKAAGLPASLMERVGEYWDEGVEQYPDGDFTEIFKTIGDS